MTAQLTAVDAVVNLLTKIGWNRTGEMESKTGPSLPVFTTRCRRCELRCVVGPLWVTHYRLDGDVVSHQDSTKTADLEGVRVALCKLSLLGKD